MSSSSTKVSQPEWHGPHGAGRLRAHNSLTSSRVPFVPADPEGRRVGWYTCGPTVYDSAHLGHARCYITFDIIRRIMTDYFKYNVFYVMNITDLDDKIILRARRNHLLASYSKAATDAGKVAADAGAAFEAALGKQRGKVTQAEGVWQESAAKGEKYASEHKVAFEEEQAKLQMAEAEQAAFQKEVEATKSLAAGESIPRLLSASGSALSEWLDAAQGADVTDHSIFASHAA